MSRCKVCSHPARTEIEVAIAAGESARGIARRYSMDKNNVASHLAHMPDAAKRRVERGVEFVEKAVEEAFEVAVETLRSHRREGRNAAGLEAGAQVVKLAPALLDQFERRREEEAAKESEKESRADLIESISKLLPKVEPALVVGDAELLQRVVAAADPLLLLENLKLRLRLQPELRRRAAEACAEGIIGGFEYGQREAALAAFEAEHRDLRKKLFPEPAAPPEPPLSDEEQARVVQFEPNREG